MRVDADLSGASGWWRWIVLGAVMAVAVTSAVAVQERAGATGSGARPSGPSGGIVSIDVGIGGGCLVDAAGKVRCWGSNSFGLIGIGRDQDDDGWSWQALAPETPATLPAGRTATSVARGEYHACALLDDGQVTCWGQSPWVGIDVPLTSFTTPIPPIDLPDGRRATSLSSSFRHTCAVLDDGGVACWGSNDRGEIGNGESGFNTFVRTPERVDLPEGRRATSVSTSASHTCALLDDGSVSCWGANWSGQVDGNDGEIGSINELVAVVTPSPPLPLPAGRIAVAVEAALGSTCAVLDDGTIRCWGSLRSLTGAPDDQAIEPPGMEVPFPGEQRAIGLTSRVFGNRNFFCALLADRSASCWGHNNVGQLGIGEVNDPGEFVWPPADPVEVGGAGIAEVAAGGTFACALTVDGGFSCWGSSANGQLGNGEPWSADDPPVVSPPPPAALPGGIAAGSVVRGGEHGCSSLSNGNVICWGDNTHGQLGADTEDDAVSAPGVYAQLPAGTRAGALAAGAGHTCALLGHGGVACWGDNRRGQLGAGITVDSTAVPVFVDLPVGSSAVALTARGDHTCALTDAGAVVCWGDDAHGQLGASVGSDDMSATPLFVDLGGVTAVAVAAGRDHTCALSASRNVVCWGDNTHGQLGTGSTDPVDAPFVFAGACQGFCVRR